MLSWEWKCLIISSSGGFSTLIIYCEWNMNDTWTMYFSNYDGYWYLMAPKERYTINEGNKHLMLWQCTDTSEKEVILSPQSINHSIQPLYQITHNIAQSNTHPGFSIYFVLFKTFVTPVMQHTELLFRATLHFSHKSEYRKLYVSFYQ